MRILPLVLSAFVVLVSPAIAHAQQCTTADPFVSLGGGTCCNGGWLPPGMSCGSTPAPPPSTPVPSPSPTACSTPDPFAALGGGTCCNGGWLPPGMNCSSTPIPPPSIPAPEPPAPGAPGCAGADPFASIGGGVCVNGGWVPLMLAPSEPFQHVLGYGFAFGSCNPFVGVVRSAADVDVLTGGLLPRLPAINFGDEMAVVMVSQRTASAGVAVDGVRNAAGQLVISAVETTPPPICVYPAVMVCRVDVVVVRSSEAPIEIRWGTARQRATCGG